MKATRELVQQVYDVYEETKDYRKTARLLDLNEKTVREWVKNPAQFDPYLDYIAIERALLGERKVYQALTRWEKDEVYAKIQEILDAYHPQEDSERMGEIYDFYRDSWGVGDEGIRQALARKVRSRTAA